MIKKTKGILIKEEVGFKPELPTKKVKKTNEKEVKNGKKEKK